MKDPRDWKNILMRGADNVGSRITQVAADDLAQRAFGKDGWFSGFGVTLAKLFGREAGGTGVVETQILSLGTTATTTSTSLASVAASATQASAALSTIAASSAGGGKVGLFSFLGSMLDGYAGTGGLNPGDFGPGGQFGNIPAFAIGSAFVPADGIYRLHKGERVTDAATNRRGGTTTTVNRPHVNLTQFINVPPGANTASIAQTMRQANRQLEAERFR